MSISCFHQKSALLFQSPHNSILHHIGHPTYDKYTHEMFQMHVMVVGTISDFPARGMLSGNVVRGYKACPECLSDEGSSSHCNKICKLGHRAFLPYNHEWRFDDKAFDGTVEHGVPPRRWTGEEILAVLNEYDFGQLSNHPNIVAAIPERPDMYKFWTHKSIFWELPYWSKLLIRHYLDVMHIEKNVCDSVVGTVLDNDQETIAVARQLRDVETVTLTVFQLVLSFISGPKSKPSSWSLVSKEVQSKIIACEEAKVNEFAEVDAAFNSIKNANAQNQLSKLESCIQDQLEGLKCLLRLLIKTRVSLLNILNH
ncbi:hypothetical protein ACLB2K_016311 [Fragaria x ananassa]